MLHVACCLWDKNAKSKEFSSDYDHTWVDKLYRGFLRNLTRPFRFVLFTDRGRPVNVNIEQRRLKAKIPDYGSMIQPFELDRPLIIVGLDTVITGNIDHFADYCLNAHKMAMCRDPYQPERSINGVVLCPHGHRYIWDGWNGQNDMEWLRRFEWTPIDDIWPGQVLSLKYHRIRDTGLPPEARIVYFHGRPKPSDVADLPWMQEHWR